MRRGLGSSPCCRPRKGNVVAGGASTGRWSRRSRGGIGRGRRGGTYRRSSGRGRRRGSGTTGGPVMGRGSGWRVNCKPMRTPRGSWTGRPVWTRPWCGLTSMRPALAAPARMHSRNSRCPSNSRGASSNDKNREAVETNRARQAIGRSRGGLSTKVHALVEGRGLPLATLLTPGQSGDNPQLEPLLAAVKVPRRGPGRPRCRPDRVLADKAYSHPSTRAMLRRKGIRATIPERSDQIAYRKARGSGGGRPPTFDEGLYRRRNVVERFFNRLKQWRAVATRYDKKAVNYSGGVLLAGIVLWART